MSNGMTLFIAITLAFSGAVFSQDNPVVATVNGVKIRKQAFDKAYNQNLLFVSDKVVTKEKVINDMINKVLGVQRAKKNNLDNDPVVKEKMEEVLYHAQISKDLEPQLKKIVVTDDDVKKYYAENPEYRTAHILLRVRATPSKNEVIAAQEKALEIYQTLQKSPDKFAQLANRYSQSNNAANGGDMGFQPAVRLAPEYFHAVKGKSVGNITPPIRTQFGYHIVKILAVKDFDDVNLPLYKKIVYDRKRDKILESYFDGLQKNAKVNIQEQYLKYEPPRDEK